MLVLPTLLGLLVAAAPPERATPEESAAFAGQMRTLVFDRAEYDSPLAIQAERTRFLQTLARHLSALVYERERQIRKKLHGVIAGQKPNLMGEFEETTGLVLRPDRLPPGLKTNEKGVPKFEVHAARPARRATPDGDSVDQVVVTVTQRRRAPIDPSRPLSDENGFWFRGGCTMILDMDTLELQYAIRKRITGEHRLTRQREFLQGSAGQSLRATYFKDPVRGDQAEPFAFLHRPI